MFIFVFLIFTLFAFYYVNVYLHKKRILKYVQHLPTAHELPILGIGYRFIGKSTTEIMKGLIELSSAVPNPSRRWFGRTLLVIVSSPEDMQTVLNSPNCLQKAYVYEFLGDNVGLFSAKAHVWKPTRRLLNPTFNHKVLSSFMPIFNEKSKVMVSNMEQFLGQTEHFDVGKLFFACTLDIVCATTLGVDLDFQKQKNLDVLEAMENRRKYLCSEMMKNFGN